MIPLMYSSASARKASVTLNNSDIFIEARSQKKHPISPMLSLTNFGSMPIDGGNLLLQDADEYHEAISDAVAVKYVQPFCGSKELINGISRWCLWLIDAEPHLLRTSKFLKKRVEACREYRSQSPKSGDAYKHRDTPWLFRDNQQPTSQYLAIPSTFSAHREYATCDLLSPEVIASNAMFTCMDPDGLAFAIIESSMFMSWQKSIGGRLKSDCRFSNTVVWNNLPLPKIEGYLQERIIDAGQVILKRRADHPNQSLSDLYDPKVMPTDLRDAHINLDRLVDKAFGAKKTCHTDEDRLTVLFARYKELTGVRA